VNDTITAPAVPKDLETRTNANGVEVIFEACGRCGGTGAFGPMVVFGGQCFDCQGKCGTWVTLADHNRRKHNRELAAARRARKAAAFAQDAAARQADLVAAHPLLADMFAEGRNYAGIVGEMRGTFERLGKLTEKQIAFAEKLITRERAFAESEEVRKAAKVEKIVASGPIGEVGQRRDFTGTVRWTGQYSNAFNGYTVVVFETAEGTVKLTLSRLVRFEKDATITFKATIKAHTEYARDESITTEVFRAKFAD
jgi:hypothetical protein